VSCRSPHLLGLSLVLVCLLAILGTVPRRLGLPATGTSCAQVLTPGLRVVVETGGTSYEFRTNRDGSLVRSNDQ
jgi:hypothetical protein